MFKNQLQELAQRSCFNLPSYAHIREGPDHAPRFKVSVNFNGEIFESPSFCSTIRQAEYSAAEVALDALVNRGPSNSLTARILDETGVYKNLLQEVSQRVGSNLPVYKTTRSGLGHMPVFTGVVEFAELRFTGQPAKTKKQAEKNAAMTAWMCLKQLPQQSEKMSSRANTEEQEHITVARNLYTFLRKAKMGKVKFPIIFPSQTPKPSGTQPIHPRESKILPLILPNSSNSAPQKSGITPAVRTNDLTNKNKPFRPPRFPKTPQPMESQRNRPASFPRTQQAMAPYNFPVIGAAPCIPLRHFRTNTPHGIVPPPVTVRNTMPVYSPHHGIVPPPVTLRNTMPRYTPPPPMPRWSPATAPPPPPMPRWSPATAPPPPAYFRKPGPVFTTPPAMVEQRYPVVANGEGMIGDARGKKKESGDVVMQKFQNMKI